MVYTLALEFLHGNFRFGSEVLLDFGDVKSSCTNNICLKKATEQTILSILCCCAFSHSLGVGQDLGHTGAPALDPTAGKKGVPQGGVISPLLSNLYLNEVDRMLERAREVTRNGKYTYIEYARFADDLVNLDRRLQARCCAIRHIERNVFAHLPVPRAF